VALRKSLQCKSFEWYLDNVYPEMRRYNNTLFYGEVSSALQQTRRGKRPRGEARIHVERLMKRVRDSREDLILRGL